MLTSEFLQMLKAVCLRYDKANGQYPETMFQGAAIYGFACEEAKVEDDVDWDDELAADDASPRGDQ
jgi:hypothetical protein